jgi:sulfofructosephosphate aldolase
MVAMDQRESLSTMFHAAGAGRPPAEVLVDFKLAVAEALGPLASGFLIDRHLGFDEVRSRRLLPASTGLILAADELTQKAGGPVEETALDATVLADGFDLAGVAALKLLIIWRRDEHREQRVRLAAEFIAAARARGLLSVLEPVVRATEQELAEGSWNADVAILEAASELSPLKPSLYKAQVPLGGAGTPQEQEAASAILGRAITGPWVVLSQGVDRERFHAAVRAACRGGASGFLAGRALWSDIVGSTDVPARLREVAVPRLQALVELVDREARPWQSA